MGPKSVELVVNVLMKNHCSKTAAVVRGGQLVGEPEPERPEMCSPRRRFIESQLVAIAGHRSHSRSFLL